MFLRLAIVIETPLATRWQGTKVPTPPSGVADGPDQQEGNQRKESGKGFRYDRQDSPDATFVATSVNGN